MVAKFLNKPLAWINMNGGKRPDNTVVQMSLENCSCIYRRWRQDRDMVDWVHDKALKAKHGVGLRRGTSDHGDTGYGRERMPSATDDNRRDAMDGVWSFLPWMTTGELPATTRPDHTPDHLRDLRARAASSELPEIKMYFLNKAAVSLKWPMP